MNSMKDTEIAYMAGVFDGEGWFVSNSKNTCRVSIAMTDFDVIERIYQTTGVGNLNLRKAKSNKKAQLTWAVNTMDDVEDIIHAILPYLSIRRTKDAIKVLADIGERRQKQIWRESYFICGHDKVEENTYHFPEEGSNSGKTACRECVRIRGRNKKKKK